MLWAYLYNDILNITDFFTKAFICYLKHYICIDFIVKKVWVWEKINSLGLICSIHNPSVVLSSFISQIFTQCIKYQNAKTIQEFYNLLFKKHVFEEQWFWIPSNTLENLSCLKGLHNFRWILQNGEYMYIWSVS